MRRRSALLSPVNDEFHCSLPLRALAITCCLSFLVALPGAQADSNNPALEEEQEDSLDDSVNTPSADVVADTWVPPQRHPEVAVTWVQPQSGLSLGAAAGAAAPSLNVVEPPRVIMHAKLPHKAAAEFGVHRPKVTSAKSGGGHHHHHGSWAKHFGGSKKHREVTEAVEAEKTHANPKPLVLTPLKPLDPKQALMAFKQNLVRQTREHERAERRARLIIIENEHSSPINAGNSFTFISSIFGGLSIVACMIKFGIFVR